jgi:acyl dehydratase
MTTTFSASTVQVGTELPTLALPPVSRTTLAEFGIASGDHNPIHLDIDVARAAGLQDVFAQGMLTMAYLGRLVTNWVPAERIRKLSGRFTAITPVHAAPVCTGTVTAVEIVDGVSIATVALSATLADGTVTLTATATISLET